MSDLRILNMIKQVNHIAKMKRRLTIPREGEDTKGEWLGGHQQAQRNGGGRTALGICVGVVTGWRWSLRECKSEQAQGGFKRTWKNPLRNPY